MPINSSNNIYSEDVQDIMGQIPSWIIRRGIFVIFFILITLVLGSYVFKYPDIVSRPVTLTSTNPPIHLVCKTSGRIEEWFIPDGDTLDMGMPIALLENTAEYEDVLILQSTLKSLSPNWTENLQKINLPPLLKLGKLQNQYFTFSNALQSLQKYIDLDLLNQKVRLLEQRIQNNKKYHEQLIKQKFIREQSMKLAQKIYQEDSIAYQKRVIGVSRSDFQDSKQAIFKNKTSYLKIDAAITYAEADILLLRENLIELQMKRDQELKNYTDILDKAKQLLEVQLQGWESKYLLVAPIEGVISITKNWGEYQVVQTGDRLATIRPLNEALIIAKTIIPHVEIGKVEIGQHVNIKLESFPYMEFGVLRGVVSSLSLVPEEGIAESGYLAEIELENGMNSSYQKKLKFIPGMTGNAEIITQEKRLIFRFIKL